MWINNSGLLLLKQFEIMNSIVHLELQSQTSQESKYKLNAGTEAAWLMGIIWSNLKMSVLL